MARMIPAFAIVLLSTVALAQTTKIPSGVDEYFKKLIQDQESASYSVGIMKQGKLVFARGYGLANLEHRTKATPNTVYRIGSITKQFTATMIMQLRQEGKLQLEDSITKFIEGIPPNWSAVTVRQLLNHTSGIPSYTDNLDVMLRQSKLGTKPEGIYKSLLEKPLEFAPGSKWNYNNTGYVMLGMIIEKLDGRPFAASLETRITKPLGMNQTYFTSERTLVPNRAQGYVKTKTGFENCAYLNMDWPFAAGSMESSVPDMAKWDAALYGDKILPQSALAEMWTPTTLTTGAKQPYGYGWGVDVKNKVPFIHHGGGIYGFLTHFGRVPSKGWSVVVLTNAESADPGGDAEAVLKMLIPEMKEPAIAAMKDAHPELTKAAQAVLQSALDNKLDRTKLTPNFSKVLTPELVEQTSNQLGALGPIKAFYLIAEEKVGEKLKRTYRVTIGGREFNAVVATTPDGLIDGMEVTS